MSIAIFVVLALVLAGLSRLITTAYLPSSSGDMSPEAVALRIAPVGKLNTGDPIVVAAAEPAAPAGGARSGEAIYQASCFACHATGAAGAPLLGNVEAWAPRIALGMEALLATAISGKGAMPPRGTCGTCSDDDLMAAIEYMVSQSQ
ncbi:cytochrome c5 family protein [Ectothiorhodospiraceae bacterium BW-2]|nr:cytochrome c5 family protein [Ectothiorhodospiraceae bacterium BW-2]